MKTLSLILNEIIVSLNLCVCSVADRNSLGEVLLGEVNESLPTAGSCLENLVPDQDFSYTITDEATTAAKAEKKTSEWWSWLGIYSEWAAGNSLRLRLSC